MTAAMQLLLEVRAAAPAACWPVLNRAVAAAADTAAGGHPSVAIAQAAIGPAPQGFQDVRHLFQQLGQGRADFGRLPQGGGVDAGGGDASGGDGPAVMGLDPAGGADVGGLVLWHGGAPVAVVEGKAPGRGRNDRQDRPDAGTKP